jgi:hypothetical protein
VTSPILLASPRPQWELRQLKPLLARPGRASADSLPPTQAHSDTCRRSERLRQGHCNTAHRKHTEGVRQNKASEKKNSWTGVRAAGRCSRAERRKERKAPRLLNDTHANRALLANARVRLAEGSPCGGWAEARLTKPARTRPGCRPYCPDDLQIVESLSAHPNCPVKPLRVV